LRLYHDHPTAGHPGRDETLQTVTKRYWWPNIRTEIKEYVKGCGICQQNKNITHKTYIPPYKITTPATARPFLQIALDLITGLPKSQGYDAILTIMDHGCSRAALFLPCNTMITGPGIAELYFQHVYRWFGLPQKVISDRDPCFTLHFGKALKTKLQIDSNLSTAFHPQMDGLTERSNQWIKQYLQLVIGAKQND
jgi:hypothetical protein